MLQVDKKTTIYSDLTAAGIKKDLEDTRAVTEISTEIFMHLFTDKPLLCILSGAVAADEVSSDTSNAKMIRKTKMQQFIVERLKSLLDPIKKLKLKTLICYFLRQKTYTSESNTKLI